MQHQYHHIRSEKHLESYFWQIETCVSELFVYSVVSFNERLAVTYAL